MNDLFKNDKVNNIKRVYFPELDGLRFFAFLLVFIHHDKLFSTIPHFRIFHTNGWIGVDLFFALSAFLFTKLLIAEFDKTKTINFKNFYIRRLFRIWPLYFLFILFSTIVYFFEGGVISNNIVLRIFGLFSFSDNIMTAIYHYNPLPYVSHLWTIAYEQQFYIVIPFIIFYLVRLSCKTKLIFATFIFILLSGIRLIFIANNVPHPAIWVLPITHFDSILLGVVIGFGGFDFLLKKVNPLLIGLIGLMFFVVLYFLPPIKINSYWLMASYLIAGLSTSMILFSVSNSKILRNIFSHNIFVFLGKRSYGLYVYHLLGNEVAKYIIDYVPGIPSNLFAAFIYSLCFTVIVSIISYKIIETPFLKIKKKFEIIISRPI